MCHKSVSDYSLWFFSRKKFYIKVRTLTLKQNLQPVLLKMVLNGTTVVRGCVFVCACVVVSSDKHVVSFGQMEPGVINKVRCHQVSSIAD